MKKNYFMLAAATVMFAACAETDLVNEINEAEAQYAIGFETFTNKTTRAEWTAEGLKEEGGGFQVWGYKTSGSYSHTVFNGVDVTWSDSKWGYTDTQYWDEKATYNFYAVAPAEGSYSITDGNIKITNVASANKNDSKDYLIDRAGNTNVDGSKKQLVEFDFNHVMAKLSFVLKKATGIDDDITVTKLTMSGWNGSAGTFTQSLKATPTDNSHGEWSYATANDVTGSFDVVASNLPIDAVGVEVTNEYIVVPQTVTYTAATVVDGTETIPESGLTFTISYIIGDVTTGEVFTEQVGVMPSNQVWGTDTHTTYTITVGPAAIEFSAKTVAGFQDNTGSTTTIK